MPETSLKRCTKTQTVKQTPTKYSQIRFWSQDDRKQGSETEVPRLPNHIFDFLVLQDCSREPPGDPKNPHIIIKSLNKVRHAPIPERQGLLDKQISDLLDTSGDLQILAEVRGHVLGVHLATLLFCIHLVQHDLVRSLVGGGAHGLDIVEQIVALLHCLPFPLVFAFAEPELHGGGMESARPFSQGGIVGAVLLDFVCFFSEPSMALAG